ncbi:MAG: hypothetical protein HRT87_02590 [Legionellales bacterium]|nr:hypothetical protein [Legionellales bacterium]
MKFVITNLICVCLIIYQFVFADVPALQNNSYNLIKIKYSFRHSNFQKQYKKDFSEDEYIFEQEVKPKETISLFRNEEYQKITIPNNMYPYYIKIISISILTTWLLNDNKDFYELCPDLRKIERIINLNQEHNISVMIWANSIDNNSVRFDVIKFDGKTISK